jgi:hypothetical protein
MLFFGNIPTPVIPIPKKRRNAAFDGFILLLQSGPDEAAHG